LRTRKFVDFERAERAMAMLDADSTYVLEQLTLGMIRRGKKKGGTCNFQLALSTKFFFNRKNEVLKGCGFAMKIVFNVGEKSYFT
jgi:hypothetical protein